MKSFGEFLNENHELGSYSAPDGYSVSVTQTGDELHAKIVSPTGKSDKVRFSTPPKAIVNTHPLARAIVTQLKARPEDYLELGGKIIRKEAGAMVKKALEDHQAQRQAILDKHVPGLDELRRALEAHRNHRDQFRRMMDDEHNDGVKPPIKPVDNVESLRTKYPAAAAYLEAEGYSEASNFHKVAAGTKALARIKAGEDFHAVIADMHKEWKDSVDPWA